MNGVAGIIVAIGGVLAILCNFILNLMTLRVTQSNGRKLDVNTVATVDARQTAALAVAAASQAATAARTMGATNAEALASVAAGLEAVRVQSNGNTDKLIASALVQGQLEGHAAGVAAEQARTGMTGIWPVKPQ